MIKVTCILNCMILIMSFIGLIVNSVNIFEYPNLAVNILIFISNSKIIFVILLILIMPTSVSLVLNKLNN